MDLGIKGRWALVCGASKGLGYGCAEALVREGVNVLVVARGSEMLEKAVVALKASTSAEVLSVAADITSADGRRKVFGVRSEFDILITNAGGPPAGDFREWDRDTWLGAIDASMLTPIELMKASVDGMAARGFGRVVNITSTAVKAPLSALGLSNGARSGLTGFVAGIARTPQLAAAGVTINNLLPGFYDTDRLRGGLASAARARGLPVETITEERINSIPARRLGSAAEFGSICAFLCSQQAAYITGQNILPDGGAYPGTF